MAFVKVKYLFPPDMWEDTAIINTDDISFIVKCNSEQESYLISYKSEMGSFDPRFLDRENAEKILKAIGMSLD